MKFHTRLAVLALALSGPAFAQEAQMPRELEQRLGAVLDVRVAVQPTASLAARERALEAALARDVSARVEAALVPPARLGTVVARHANATEPSMRGARRVLYAAK